MKEKKLIFGIALAFVFLASFGFSYAYFSNAITNKDVKDKVVETGTLSLRYVDVPKIVMNNIKPDDTFTKTIYVANTGTMEVTYNLIWQELVNEIENNEMVLSATCTRMNGTTASVWWLRSAHSYDYYDFYTVIRSGDLSDASAYGICVISPAFRIG